MITIEDMVHREVNCCMSSMIATLAAGQHCIQSPRSVRSQQEATELNALALQAVELIVPTLDYEEAAIQAGWKPKKLTANRSIWLYIDDKAGEHDQAESAQEACEKEGVEPYYLEVYEHWAISTWLAEKLLAQGERVDTGFAGLNIWARTTTGQQISADNVIERIYTGMVSA